MGNFLFILGMIVNTVTGLFIIYKAFQKSVGWGLAVIFIPFAGLFFIINNWQDVKTPFLVGLGGGALMIVGIISGIAASEDSENKLASPTAQRRSSRDSDDDPGNRESASYASAAATPAAPVQTSTYTPSYAPTPTSTPAPTPVAMTDTKPAEEDLWTRKPTLEQVWVDRDTWLFFSEKCKKLPPNGYRIPKSVAVAQGLTEGKCK